MKQSIVGVFASQKQAELALKEISFDRLANEEISILRTKNSMVNNEDFNDLNGFVIEGGNYSITDVGEAYVAGPFADKLKNNTAQNFKGALMVYGVTPEAAENYEALVQEGKTILIIETNGAKANKVANTISDFGGKAITRWNRNLNHSL